MSKEFGEGMARESAELEGQMEACKRGAYLHIGDLSRSDSETRCSRNPAWKQEKSKNWSCRVVDSTPVSACAIIVALLGLCSELLGTREGTYVCVHVMAQ